MLRQAQHERVREAALSKPIRIALVGATGMIGMTLIRMAVQRPDIRVIAVSRREIALPPGARMEVLVADPEHWDDAIAAHAKIYGRTPEGLRNV